MAENGKGGAAGIDPHGIPPHLLEQFRDPNWGAEKLKEIDILKKFSLDELKELYDIGELRIFKPKTYAVIEGEPSRGLFIILKGSASVYKTDDISGNMHRIAYLEEGAYFGELSLFDNYPRTATVAAETAAVMFALDAEPFEAYIARLGPEAMVRFYRSCAEDMVARFRALNTDYINSQQQLWKHAMRKTDAEGSNAAAGEPDRTVPQGTE